MITAPNCGKVPMIADGRPDIPDMLRGRLVDHRMAVGHSRHLGQWNGSRAGRGPAWCPFRPLDRVEWILGVTNWSQTIVRSRS
jgi:hypothetical protein